MINVTIEEKVKNNQEMRVVKAEMKPYENMYIISCKSDTIIMPRKKKKSSLIKKLAWQLIPAKYIVVQKQGGVERIFILDADKHLYITVAEKMAGKVYYYIPLKARHMQAIQNLVSFNLVIPRNETYPYMCRLKEVSRWR